MPHNWKPSPGWRYLGSSTWTHGHSGLRLHVYGQCMLPDGTWIDGRAWPESRERDRCVAICGSRRRGAMVWAMRKVKEAEGAKT